MFQSQPPLSAPAASPYAVPEPFACTWKATGPDGAWVYPVGEVDLATAPRLELTLREAIGQARLIVLDLRAVSFMDSAGIHVILAAATEARETGGRLALVRGPAQLQRMLALTDVNRHIMILNLDRQHLPQRQRRRLSALERSPRRRRTR